MKKTFIRKLILCVLLCGCVGFGSVCLGFLLAGTGVFVTTDTAEEKNSAESTVSHPTSVRTPGTTYTYDPANDNLYRKYVIQFPVPTPVPEIEPEIAAEEDFSPYAQASTGSDGYLNLPDNSVVEDISATKIKTKYFSLTIPGSWVGNVVTDCRYVDESATKLAHPVYDTLILSFYEKKNYDAYRENGNGSTDSNKVNGFLTELRFANKKNDNTWMKTSNYYTYWADAQDGDNTYEVFLYEPHSAAGVSSEENAARYRYLSETVNFEGCLIHSFRVANSGSLTYTDSFIKKAYIDNWDPAQTGIPEGSTIP